MKRRIEYVDLIKGFGILTVVIGHFIAKNFAEPAKSIPSYNFIYSFHMPLFMFIGGYVAYLSYRNAKFRRGGNYLLKKSRELMLPYLMGPLLIAPFFTGNVDLADFAPASFLTNAFSTIRENEGSWFLIAFWSLSLMGFVTMAAGNRFRTTRAKLLTEGAVLGALLMIVFVIYNIHPFELCRHILSYFLFFFVGVLLCQYRALQRLATRKSVYAVCMVVFLAGASQFVAQDNRNVLKLIVGLSSVPVFYYMARRFNLPTALRKFLLLLGRHSLAIYLVHWYLLSIFADGYRFSGLAWWWITFIAVAGSLIISYICVLFAKLVETVPPLNLLLFGKKMS